MKPSSSSHAPSYACKLWHDRQAIYVELASGLITKFDKTEGALSKVLGLLVRESRPTAKPSRARVPTTKDGAFVEVKRVKPEVTTEAKDRAMNILKRKGLV